MSAPAHIARENGKKGGRPKSSSTIKAIKTKQMFVDEVEKNLGPIIQSLLFQASQGNVIAIKELLDRAWGKPHQAIDVNGKVEFSLIALAKRADELERIEQQKLNSLS